MRAGGRVRGFRTVLITHINWSFAFLEEYYINAIYIASSIGLGFEIRIGGRQTSNGSH